MLLRLELPRDDRAPGVARRAMDRLPSTFDGETVEDVRLLLSELVTNSVRHGSGDTVTVLLDAEMPGALRCEVIDDGHGFVPRARRGDSTGGWGLELVERLATSWGVREGSTHVWFEFATSPSRGA
jgi:two-component sensor histidine kinase